MVVLSERKLRVFIIVTLFLALSSFLIGLVSLANFAFPTVAAVGGSLSIAVFLVAYLVRSNYQIPREHYPIIAGTLDCLLGSVVAYICLPNLEVSVYNFANYSDPLGIGALNFSGLLMVLFGTVASVIALLGGKLAYEKELYDGLVWLVSGFGMVRYMVSQYDHPQYRSSGSSNSICVHHHTIGSELCCVYDTLSSAFPSMRHPSQEIKN